MASRVTARSRGSASAPSAGGVTAAKATADGCHFAVRWTAPAGGASIASAGSGGMIGGGGGRGPWWPAAGAPSSAASIIWTSGCARTSASSARIHLRSWHGSTPGCFAHVGRIRLPAGRRSASITSCRLNSTV